MENLDRILKNSAYQGFILGIAIIVFTVLIYVSGIHLFSITSGIVMLLVLFAGETAFTVIYQKKYRNSIGGKISFGQLFVYGFVLLIVASIIGVIFNYLLYNIIDPDYLTQQVDYFIEDISRWIDDADQLDKMAVEMSTKMDDMKDIVPNLLKVWIGPLVISLITSLIIKKDINE